MSPAERIVYLCIGILFAWMGIGGLILAVGLLIYGFNDEAWPIALFVTPIGLLLVLGVFVCAWESIHTFRTGRL